MRVFLILLITILVTACCNTPTKDKQYKYNVSIRNGSGWSKSFGYVNCDSVTMISSTNAILYIDGVKSNIIADKITISTNN